MQRHVYGERLAARAAVALRSADGLALGTVHWIEGERLLVEVDTTLTPGEACELRVDASPERGTVLIHGRAVRQLVGGTDDMPRFVVRLVGVVEEDLPAFNAWLDHIRAVGTGPEVSVVSYQSGGPSSVSTARTLDAHTRSGVEPAALHASFPTPSQASSPAPAPRGAAARSDVSPSGATAGGARERLRQALVGFRKTHPVVDAE